MGGIELSEGTLHDYQDIAALQTESWRSAYRGILPVSYLDGPILEERETHWKNLMLSAGGKRRSVFLAKDCGALLGFACVLLDEEPAWGARLDNIHVRPAYKGRGTGRLLFRSAAEWVSTCEPHCTYSFSKQTIRHDTSTSRWVVKLWNSMPRRLRQELWCHLSVSYGRNPGR
jgi:GNAT superfamily N-acetyltransferase